MAFLVTIFMLIQRLFYVALGIFGIGFLIGIHELGHFLFCKLFRIATPSFSIGFGPKIFARKIGETEFSLSAIPLGGYVEIAGAAEMGQGEQKHAHSADKYSFAVKPYYQKLLVMLGGIFFNLIFAYIAFIILSMTGIQKTPIMYPLNASGQISHIEPGSPAEKAGLKAGDLLVSAAHDTQTLYSDILPSSHLRFTQFIRSNPNKKIQLYLKNDPTKETTVIIGEKKIDGKVVGYLGAGFTIEAIPPTTFLGSFIQGIKFTNFWIKRTFQAFGSIFKNGETKNLGGPLAVISMTIKGASAGFQILLLLLAIISINLAILNLIPLPILDGGQILFYTIEAIIGRPLPLKVREWIHIATWIMLGTLILFLSARDIYRMASPNIESIKQFLGFSR